MKAKKLFQPTTDMSRSERYMAALIIMQSKCWAYYSVLVNTEVIWTDRIQTAGCDGIYVYVNPDFFRSLPSDGQRAFLLAHEVAHKILRHGMRGRFYRDRGFHSMQNGKQLPFIHSTWNIAADAVINADLLAHGLEPIPEGIYMDNVDRDQLVDHVYISLAQEQQQEQEQEQQQDDSGSDQNDQQD